MKYIPSIGIEMHCEITSTLSKVFSTSKNSYELNPNINISLSDLAFPGTLPVVNKEAVKKALMASIILNCEIPKYVYFERKNYFYPDLPKGYQITQDTKPAPIGIYGYLDYICNGEKKRVRINNIHLEEDTASLTHYDDITIINYNRVGVPLLELVTEPDFHSAEEVVSFLEAIKNMYEYTDISTADSKKGQIRCDVNISIKDINDKENNYGTKVEVKNVNSFSSVKECILYEVDRQISLKENNTYKDMKEHTRRWSEEEAKTIYMRVKDESVDYRYFVDPNIPKIKIDEEWIKEIKSLIPMLPLERKEKYMSIYKLSDRDTNILIKNKCISDYFEECVNIGINPKEASNWIITNIMNILNKENITIDKLYLTPNMLKDICDNINSNKISSYQAKEIFNICLEEHKEPVIVIKEHGFIQNSNEEEIKKIVKNVIFENKDIIEDIKKGKTGKIGYLVGQVLKISNGKFNPKMVSEIINKELEKC